MQEIYTIGHSTRSLEEFIALLREHSITHLVDVRSTPGSRRYPHFGQYALPAALRAAGITYTWLPELGGRRKTRKDSKNLGWKNVSFRGYADYMETKAFEEGIENLEAIAHKERTAIMCAEAVPWRCHRGLISDALVARGWQVHEILGEGQMREHALTAFAKVHHKRVSYEGKEADLFSPRE